MKKIIFTLVIALFLNFNAAAQQTSALKIAVFDAQSVITNSIAAKNANDVLQKRKDQFQQEITKKEKELDLEKRKIKGKKEILSEERYQEEVAKFGIKFENFKNYVEERQIILKNASSEVLVEIEEVLRDIINDIAKEQNIDLILPSEGVIFSKDEFDVSPLALTRLNKNLKKITIKSLE